MEGDPAIKPVIVIANRVVIAQRRLKLVPSFEQACSQCGEMCLLSEAASRQAVDAGVPVWCIPCFEKRRHPDDEFVRTAAGAMETDMINRRN